MILLCTYEVAFIEVKMFALKKNNASALVSFICHCFLGLFISAEKERIVWTHINEIEHRKKIASIEHGLYTPTIMTRNGLKRGTDEQNKDVTIDNRRFFSGCFCHWILLMSFSKRFSFTCIWTLLWAVHYGIVTSCMKRVYEWVAPQNIKEHVIFLNSFLNSLISKTMCVCFHRN